MLDRFREDWVWQHRQEYVTLVVYKLRLEKLYDDFYKESISIGIKSENQRSLLLAYAI